jgi:hypothetical protein
MDLTAQKVSCTSRLLWSVMLLTIFALLCQAQTAYSESSVKKETKKKEKPLSLDFYAETSFEYNDNVFKLTESQISTMAENAAKDAVGGRFEGMESTSDFIVEPTVGIRVNAKSPLGGKFGLTSWIRYNHYTQNRDASYSEGRIRLKNTIGKNDSLALQGTFLSGFYRKNYLSGVNDTNRNGNITRIERIYSPAFYDEYEGMLEYERNVIKNKESAISRVDARPFIGYHDRSYNAIFHNRDQNIPFIGVGLSGEFGGRVNINIIYLYERVSSPNNFELILFDETISRVDVNGDYKIKANAPLTTKVNRSCRRHTIEIDPSWELAKNFAIYAGYERRTSDYIADNPLDIEHFNIGALRQRISAGTKYSISKAWSAEVEYRRIDDDNDEDGNYLQNIVQATIRYKFN